MKYILLGVSILAVGCAPTFKDCKHPERAVKQYENCFLRKKLCKEVVEAFYCEPKDKY